MKGDVKLGLFLAALVAGVIAARPVLHAPVSKAEPSAPPASPSTPKPKAKPKKTSDDPFLFPSDSDAAEVKTPASQSGWSNDLSSKSTDHAWQNDELGKSKDDTHKLTMPAPQPVASAATTSGLTDVIPDGYPPPGDAAISPPAKLPAKEEPAVDKTMLIDFAQKDEPATKLLAEPTAPSASAADPLSMPAAETLALPEPTRTATTKTPADDEPVTAFVPFVTESETPTADAASKGPSPDGWEGAAHAQSASAISKQKLTAAIPTKTTSDTPLLTATPTALSSDTPVVQSYDRRIDSPAAPPRGKGPIHPFYQRYLDEKTYFVRPGDSLENIAARLYQDDSMANEILKANRDQLPVGAPLRPGMTLILP